MSKNNEENKNKESKNFLLIYGIIILIILLLIMFVFPDDLFMLKYKDLEIPEEATKPQVEKKEFVPYEVMKNNLLNSSYEYEYVLLDSMGTKTYQYNCSGKMDKGIEVGTCTKPTSFSYTEKTKVEEFKISTKYLEVATILELIKNSEPKIDEYPDSKEYYYETMIEDLDTDVTIYTDLENITRVDISNAYMTYILKYSDIKN